jgi:regulator of cell morphogenesis and NO signaling
MSIAQILLARPVADIALGVPGAAAALRAAGVGFCCHPDRPLADAAVRRGVDAAALAEEIAVRAARPHGAPEDTIALIAYIVNRYHSGHRRALAAAIPLARKVERVHADAEGAPVGLAELLEAMTAELEDHMWKEEERLFPMMLQGGAGLIAGPLAQMRAEHADQTEHLLALEHVTRGHRTPEDACGSWRTLMDATRDLMDELIAHMWLENAVLFPRFEGGPAPRPC